MYLAIILLVIIGFIILKFQSDRKQQAIQIIREGGMRKKYYELIEYLKSGDTRSSILHESSDTLTVGVSSKSGGSTVFILMQTFGFLTVAWKLDNPIVGRHKKEWDFPENTDQKKMMDIIANDLSVYQQNLMRKHGLS